MMKKISLFLVVALIAIIGFSMAGCGTNASAQSTPDAEMQPVPYDPEQPLVGIWERPTELSGGNTGMDVWTFNSDGTYTVEYINNSSGRSTIHPHKWTASGNTLTSIVPADGPIPEERTTITYTISGNTLTMLGYPYTRRTQPQPVWGTSQPSPVGTWSWRYTNGPETNSSTYTFNANGTGTLNSTSVNPRWNLNNTYTFTWTASGNRLTMVTTERNGNPLSADSTLRTPEICTYRISDNTITFRSEGGTSKFTRQ